MKTNDLHILLPASKSLSNRWLMLNHILGLRQNGNNPNKGLPFMLNICPTPTTHN